MNDRKVKQNQRLTTKEKNAKNKQWYKDQADMLDDYHGNLRSSAISNNTDDISEYRRMKINYDLYNNILNLSDFKYVCKPFGEEGGELPAKMVNRDIVSGKIKAVLGMEMKRPFSWKVIATNKEATTRIEKEEFSKIRDFVISSVMNPIQEKINTQAEQENKGRELSPDEQAQIQQKVEEDYKAATPEEVKRYMKRDHQDPAEVLSHQLLNYLIEKINLKRKFNDGFKHMHLSAKEIFYVGTFNGEPEVWNVNPLRFNCDISPDTQFIEDGEWATCEYRMTPSEVIQYFNSELSQSEIDKIYTDYAKYENLRVEDRIFSFTEIDEEDTSNTVRVLHCTWKSLRKLKFLEYIGEDGETASMIVDETYKLDRESGDISTEEVWIPEVYEAWKIGNDIYKNMQPIPGQFKDLDNLYYCKLPYYGAICDNMNSIATGIMDRLKVYQYYYNIVMYRVELLLASDEGKKVLMNINAIPDSAGIDIEKWTYFMKSSSIMWYDPNEEGSSYQDVNTVAKTIDLSLASDIGRYIELAEYLKKQAGISVGITEAIEGQIGTNESVGNSQANLINSSHILEPYFELHNNVKRNVLQALLETAKVAYANSKPRKLNYVLDDMSREIIDLDPVLLDNSTLGIFVSNSSKADQSMQTIQQLAHAAMQNQRVELSDVITVLRQEGLVEAEEVLKVAEDNRREQEGAAQKAQQEAIAEEEKKKREFRKTEHEMEKETIILKEEEKRKTEVIKGSLMAASFNADQDVDNDGVNDFVEIARDGLNADIKREKNQLDREKFEHQKKVDTEKIKIEKVKIKKDKNN